MNISKEQRVQINEEIRDPQIRVIGSDGSQLGLMSSRDAFNMASNANLDLVKIAPGAQPPVCRIMDYGKYRYEQQKREKEAKKNQHVVEIKEIRLGLNTDVHDFDTKVNQAKKFLTGGNRIKVSIRFRGREMAHPEHGKIMMEKFADALAEIAGVDKPPKMEGRSMQMFLTAKKTS